MFQFPSNGKARGNLSISSRQRNLSGTFQFPSNGKARGNTDIVVGGDVQVGVSIPFKREGTGKPETCRRRGSDSSFHSLQTGRHGETASCWSGVIWSRCRVSIPFKREGTGKQIMKAKTLSPRKVFQFPSNGKVRGNQNPHDGSSLDEFLFQFPSNGKARGNNQLKSMSGQCAK